MLIDKLKFYSFFLVLGLFVLVGGYMSNSTVATTPFASIPDYIKMGINTLIFGALFVFGIMKFPKKQNGIQQ